VSVAPPSGARGSIALVVEHCTVCMLCARECPDWCLYIEGHAEGAEAGPTGPAGRSTARARTLVLDRFAIDWSLCMYCGICVEVCPFDALHWKPEAVAPESSGGDLLHEAERLEERSAP